ncbi:MAG TPA: hypothetical protein VNL91_10415 [Thermoanaerobaculia bacterium]|nr:hypothetical protein [Thermoanaerobaculia bacterium]
MHAITILLLITTFELSGATILVLRSGETIEVSGMVREENGRILFRNAAGTLYSLPAGEIDLKATEAASAPRTAPAPEGKAKLRVTPEEKKRLLEELAKNRAGQPASPPDFDTILSAPTPAAAARTAEDEWYWRNRARDHEEAVRRAKEHLQLLVARAERLRSEIATLFSLGYKPSQFTYQSTVLQSTLEQIPYAELEVQRAERAWEQFRDEARRRDIMPGWLR